jgi:hypothetical protein
MPQITVYELSMAVGAKKEISKMWILVTTFLMVVIIPMFWDIVYQIG